jgi:hypothetical protein
LLAGGEVKPPSQGLDWSLPMWHMTWPLAHLSACVARYRLGIKNIWLLFEIFENIRNLENHNYFVLNQKNTNDIPK